MTENTTPIAQTPNYIVLEKYEKLEHNSDHYQTEAQLENELIADLQSQGIEYIQKMDDAKMLANVRQILQELNQIQFTDSEWQRFVMEYLDKPSESLGDKTRKIQDNHIYDFTFDDGHIKNIKLVDKKNLSANKVQVIH